MSIALKTICRDCCFATYDNNTQIGCDRNQLNILTQAGGILQEYVDEYGKEFSGIDGLICTDWRNQDWYNKYRGSVDEQLIKENIITYSAFIVANDNFKDLQATINSLTQQVLPPKQITILRTYRNKIHAPAIINLLSKLKIKWRIQNELEDSGISMIDDAVNNINTVLYSIFYAGFEVPKQLFFDINKNIINQTLKFAIILPNHNGNGYIAPTIIHHHYIGNFGKSLEEKVKDDKWTKMIYPIKTLFDYFPE